MPSNDILQEVNQVLAETIDSNSPMKSFTKYEIKSVINSLKPRKSPGYDLITATLLKNLSEKEFTFLTYLYKAILRLCFIPPQWKVAEIKMILKPGKSSDDVKSYRPISLLASPSKVMELLFLKEITPVVESKRLIPSIRFQEKTWHRRTGPSGC